jgi:hypothetical protein
MKWLKNKYLISSIIGLVLYAIYHYYSNYNVIAKVGDLKIYKSEFLQEMKYRSGIHLDKINSKVLLSEIIEKKLLLNKAYDLNLDENFRLKREFEYILMGEVRKRYIEEARKNIKIEPKDVIDYYSQNKALYLKPTRYKLAIIFYKKEKKISKKREENIFANLNTIIQLANENKLPSAKEGFGDYALEYSEHRVTRYKGGLLGWFTHKDKNMWEQEVLKAGLLLDKVGDISPIVEGSRGYYLVRLAEKEMHSYRLFESVKNNIYHKMILEKQASIKQNFNTELKEQFDVSINEDRLNELVENVLSKEGNKTQKLPFLNFNIKDK